MGESMLGVVLSCSKLLPCHPMCMAYGVSSTSPICAALRAQIRTKLRDLQLDDELVWKREEAREASPEWVKAPWFIQAFYILLCWVRAAPPLSLRYVHAQTAAR